jgi:hypothetical protein
MIKLWIVEFAKNEGALTTMTQIHTQQWFDDYDFDIGINVLKYIGSERYPREKPLLTDSRSIKI